MLALLKSWKFWVLAAVLAFPLMLLITWLLSKVSPTAASSIAATEDKAAAPAATT